MIKYHAHIKLKNLILYNTRNYIKINNLYKKFIIYIYKNRYIYWLPRENEQVIHRMFTEN